MLLCAEGKNIEACPIGEFKGIVVLKSLEDLSFAQLAEIRGVKVFGFTPEESVRIKTLVESLYEKIPLCQELIEKIQKNIIEYYQENQQEVLVEISSQSNDSGVLQVVVKNIQKKELDSLVSQHNIDELFEKRLSIKEEESQFALSPHQEKVLSIKDQVTIKGIILVSCEDQMYKPTHLSEEEIEGVQIHFNSSECLDALKDDLAVYLQQPLDEEVLCEIEQTIFSYYYKIRYPFVLIEFPKQDITSGILRVVVCESTLGEICIDPNEPYAVHKIMDYIRLCPGDRINESILLDDVAWLNRNPFRQIDVVYQPGREEGTTDILLQANARRRCRLYGGVDNTGVKSIQRERFFAGFNLTDYHQMLTYHYASSFNTRRFQSHTVQYTRPCHGRNVLSIYGGYARVRPDIPLPITRNKGWGMQASLRYTIPCKTSAHLTHEISLGGDFKRTNNTVEFSDNTPTIANNVNLTQFMLEYKGSYSSNYNRLDYQLQGFCSPGCWLVDQTDDLYSQLRPNAKNNWIYGHLDCKFSQKLPKDFYFSVEFSGQLSNQNLLPSEQFYIGGYNTVRGYDERELNTDTGLCIRTEIYTPAFRFFSRCRDKLELLVFFDYGYANNHTPIPPEGKKNHLTSVGPGLRYAFSNYLAVRMDYGIQLYHKRFFGSNHQRVHFGLIVSY